MKKIIITAAFIIFLKIAIKAQVAINPTNTPPGFSAMLDVNSSSKGVLIPRIALTGALDNTTIPSPAVSLLIYNTANTGSGISAIVPGFHYWSGSRWTQLSGSTTSTWSLNGNAGTSPSNNFIGTTDNQPLKFRVNNLAAGEINPLTGNIAFGTESMTASSGHSNVAIGSGALRFNNEFSNLVAIGDSALYSINSFFFPGITLNPVGNVAIGSKALYSNYGGYYNTATGYNTLYTNGEGYRNTAIGAFAMQYNSDGNNNTAEGYYALSSNNTGDANTAMGSSALSVNASGNYNSAVGYRASQYATGNWNTALGCYSLLNTNTGQANVAVGFQALQNNTSGDNNTGIGTNAGPAAGFGAYSNSTAIGQTAAYTASNQVRVGNTAVIAIGGYANFVNISDIRFKKNVQPETHGLDFIMQLQPIVYNMDMQKLNHFIYGNSADTLFKGTLQKAMTDKEAILYSGFSAQQVEAAANAVDYNFSGVQKPQNEHDHYSLAYSEFVVPLVKAVQEQQLQLAKQTTLIESLQKRLDMLESKKN